MVRIDRAVACGSQRAVGRAVDLVFEAAGPGGGEADEAVVVAQLELVAILLTLMTHLVRGRAVHRAVVGVVLVGLEVAVIALAVQVIQVFFRVVLSLIR